MEQEKNLPVINGLWIEGVLSLQECLCIRSFQDAGHEFHLWHYGKVRNVPAGTVLRDAHQILPRERVFSYEAGWEGAGSVAGFSDIFRFKLLYDIGGWYVDMDVTCLQPFPSNIEYFFRDHFRYSSVGNIIYCPAGSEFALDCFRTLSDNVDARNRNWELPLKIFSACLSKHQLEKYIFCDKLPSDREANICRIAHFPAKIDPRWIAIHWCNEYWRRNHWTRNRTSDWSIYTQLMRRHGVAAWSNTRFLHDQWSCFKNLVLARLGKNPWEFAQKLLRRLRDRVLKLDLWIEWKTGRSLQPVSKRYTAPKTKTEICLFTVLQNEQLRLPYFLDYYFSLGVDRMFVVDNGSTDKTLDLLSKHSNIHVFSSKKGFERQGVWINYLLNRYGRDRWCVAVDADEIIQLPPGLGEHLQDATSALTKSGSDALSCLLLDVYSKASIRNIKYKPGDNPLDHINCFDRTGYPRRSFAGYQFITGGVRLRMFEVNPDLRKVPIFKFRKGQYLQMGQHYLSGATYYPKKGVLLHCKYLQDFNVDRMLETGFRSQVLNRRDLIAQYAHDFTLFDEAVSVRYGSVAQVQDLGLLDFPVR